LFPIFLQTIISKATDILQGEELRQSVQEIADAGRNLKRAKAKEL
jgi:hypothetical protein